MSANGTRLIAWAGGEDLFCLSKAGQIFDLEDKCGAGISTIMARLESGSWHFNDVRETIRLGLIGGGATPERAMAAIKNHVDPPNAFAPSVLVAYEIVKSVIFGFPEDDPVGKTVPAEANETGSTTTTDASDAPPSSASAPPSDGRRASPKNKRSGN
jgi:hypothetical protein